MQKDKCYLVYIYHLFLIEKERMALIDKNGSPRGWL